MATSPRKRLEQEKTKVAALADEETITLDCYDALREYADALDETSVRYKYRDEDGKVKEYKPRTIYQYLLCLRICAEQGLDLLSTSADEFNALMDTMHDEQGKSKVTLKLYQSAAAAFYRYHDLGVDPNDIHVYKARSQPKYDEMDMFTGEEVNALRQACGASGMAIRNRALLELLVFTGQRHMALLTLRIKDVQILPSGSNSSSYILLNNDYEDEHGGLKGATRRGRRRPIFGARKYVRDWLQYHPYRNDPEAWLFIGDPNHWKTDPNDHWDPSSAAQVLKRMGEAAGVTKPVNPHNFRHYCATVLKRDYDMDNDTIRMLFGHGETSRSLEDTYTHLFDQDYINKAEEALGYREPTRTSPLTPEACPTCGELLQDHWRQCPNCGEHFGPTADVVENLEDLRETAIQTALDPDQDLSPEERVGVRALLEAFSNAADDPETFVRESGLDEQ